jgi:hypothetical protein
VGVVATGVHLAVDGGVERECGPLLDRQGIDVPPEQHGPPRTPALEDRDRTRLGRAGTHVESGRVQSIADDARRAVLRERELGMGVEVAPEVDDVVEGGVHLRPQAVHPRRP